MADKKKETPKEPPKKQTIKITLSTPRPRDKTSLNNSLDHKNIQKKFQEEDDE